MRPELTPTDASMNQGQCSSTGSTHDTQVVVEATCDPLAQLSRDAGILSNVLAGSEGSGTRMFNVISRVAFDPQHQKVFTRLSSEYDRITGGLSTYLNRHPLPSTTAHTESVRDGERDGFGQDMDVSRLHCMASGVSARGYVLKALAEQSQAYGWDEVKTLYGREVDLYASALACHPKLGIVSDVAKFLHDAASDLEWQVHGSVPAVFHKAVEELCEATAEAVKDAEGQGLLSGGDHDV